VSKYDNIATLKSNLAFHEEMARRLRDRLERTLPKEPEKGTVIKFLVQFPPRPVTYQYWAARFHDKLWTITGKEGAYTWPEVVAFMRLDEGIQMGARKVEFSVVGK